MDGPLPYTTIGEVQRIKTPARQISNCGYQLTTSKVHQRPPRITSPYFTSGFLIESGAA